MAAKQKNEDNKGWFFIGTEHEDINSFAQAESEAKEYLLNEGVDEIFIYQRVAVVKRDKPTFCVERI